MITKNNKLITTSPYKIVLPYIFVSLLWLYCTDFVINRSVKDINQLLNIDIVVDTGYVLLSVIVLFFVSRKHINSIISSYHQKIAQESFYRALIENSSDLIIVSDGNGNHKYSTDNLYRILGYNLEEFGKMNLHHLIYPEDYPGMKLLHEEIKTNPTKIFRTEFRAFHKNGKTLWIDATIVNHLDDPVIKGIIINARDISVRKNAQHALQLLNEELDSIVKERTASLLEALGKERALGKMKSRFVAFASHEFRTPLTSIMASADLIKKYPDTAQQEHRLRQVDRINHSVIILTQILNDFLSVEQLESGSVNKGITLFDLPVFLEDVVAEMDGMITKKGQCIKCSHDGEVMIMQSDKILRNILLNLCSNASKYSQDGETIYLASSVVGNKVSITVKDSGIGIPEKDQEKLFAGFFRASNVGNIQGTGLGLNIVKKYVELMNGNITFTSKLNEGTTFTIDFPQAVPGNNNSEN